MSDIQYNLQFEKLCNTLQLGEIIDGPVAISGGLLHKMFFIKTIQGNYAIKALNPKIMLRPTAMKNYINSEKIANIAANNVPALPTKRFNGIFMHEIDNQYYLVFDWIDGKSIKANKINKLHCKKIGSILADIHMTNFSKLGLINEECDNLHLTDWNYYLQKGQESNSVWSKILYEIIDKMYHWNTQAIKSIRLLAKDMVISHRDLDPKNVMWIKDNPIIIDWEAAGYINPMQELTETAIDWSRNEMGCIDKDKFLTFIKGYTERYGKLQSDWKIVLENGFLGQLGWLEYNLKRSLWIECTDEDEQKLGTAQVIETIDSIRRYAEVIPDLEKWLYYEV